jgi:hypothetical protein
MRVAAVVALLLCGGPSDIAGLVVPVVVDAVDGVKPAGAQPDVFKEGLEGSTPLEAYLDTPAAIPIEVPDPRIPAPGDHALPREVFRASAHVVLGARALQDDFRDLTLVAAATLGMPSPQVCTRDSHLLPANAPTKPIREAAKSSKHFHDGVPPELQARDVFEAVEPTDRLVGNHRTSKQVSVARADGTLARLVGPIILPLTLPAFHRRTA